MILFKWDKVMLDPAGSGKYLPTGDGPYKDTNGAGGIKRSDATGADLGNSRFGPPAIGIMERTFAPLHPFRPAMFA